MPESESKAVAKGKEAPPAWVVASPETVKRAEAGDEDAMVEIANGYIELALSPRIKADDEEREAMRQEAMKWTQRRAKAMADREGDFASVRKRAEAGDAAAQRNLGFRYSQGIDVEKNEKLALEWTRKAAEAGDAKAQFNLAGAYASGRSGLKVDPAAATEWYRKALPGLKKMAKSGESGDAKPNLFVGRLLLSGEELGSKVAQDKELGMEYVRLAADQGDEEAKALIEEMDGMEAYLRQQKEASKLIESVEALAKAGDPDAKRKKERIDSWIQKGNSIKDSVKDDDEMMIKRMLFYWTTMPAVEAGYNAWYFEAGKEFAMGEIVPQDMAEASKWFQLAADFGDETAAFYLGLGYLKGIGVKKDDWRAVSLLCKASNGGHPDARPVLNSLAQTHRANAEKGDASAQFFMGVAYENAYGVERDFKKSAEWYRKAAEQGHVGAQALEVARPFDK